jgi:aryl-alcohol dehydrogenase-like predicted oxidoreductase
LAGKYTETSVLSEKQQQRPQFQGDTYLDILKRVDLIRPLAVKHHTGLQNIVLAYYLTKDVVDAVIPGARNRQQVLENLEAAEVRLDAADIALIQQAFPASYRLPK